MSLEDGLDDRNDNPQPADLKSRKSLHKTLPIRAANSLFLVRIFIKFCCENISHAEIEELFEPLQEKGPRDVLGTFVDRLMHFLVEAPLTPELYGLHLEIVYCLTVMSSTQVRFFNVMMV